MEQSLISTKAQKALVETHETAHQALEDTKTSLSDDKAELQSINSELETTKQKIQEISSITSKENIPPQNTPINWPA